MSAYTNPETYIDTQSAQSLQNLQNTIAGSFANLAQSYATRQKEIKSKLDENAKILKANDMKAQEFGFSLYTDLAKSKDVDPSVDWAKTFEPLIAESVTLRTGMLNGTLPDNQLATKRLAQIQSSVDSVTSSLANLSAAGTDYKDSLFKGVGAQGGTASSNDPRVTGAMDVLTQRLPGTKEPFFKDNDPTKLMWRVKDQGGNVLHEFDAEQLKKISRGQGLIRVVPDQIAAFDTLKSTNSGIFESKPIKEGDNSKVIPTGKVTPIYLKMGDDGKPLTKEVTIMQTGGTRVTKLVQDIDIDLIKKDPNFNSTIKSQAEGMLTDQSSAIDFYNDVISKETGRWKGTGFNFDPDKPLDDASKTKFIEDYKEYFVNTQINPTQDVTRPEGNLFTTTYNAPKPARVSKSTKGTALTGTQRSQADFNARIKEVIDTGEGGVSKGGYTLMKVKGKWGVYDKDGLEKPGTENITNPTVLATFIGGTLKKPLK